MTERLRNIGGMLFDIYSDNLHEHPVVKSIYQEINMAPTNQVRAINAMDIPMLKYVALMYDKNSPIRKETIVNRKAIAFEQAEITNNTLVDNIANFKNKRLIPLVHYYLRYQNDKAWAALCTVEEFFWELQMELSSSLSSKDDDILKNLQVKAKLRDEFSKTIEEITKYQDIVFGDNKEHMDEIINFYPEDFVEALETAAKEKKKDV